MMGAGATQMRKGVLELCVLLVIARREVYAADIQMHLRMRGIPLSPGTLYPLLSRFRKAGYVAYQLRRSMSGPPRKYYRLTARGTDALAKSLKTWTQLHATVQGLMRQS